MKNSQKFLKSLFILGLVLGFSIGMTNAQTYTISGSQTRGSGAGNNAKLNCQPVQITKNVKIVSVSGDNAGFWISKGSVVIKRYWNTNDKSAIGVSLSPGTYYVYPNLKNNQNHATVTIKLE